MFPDGKPGLFLEERIMMKEKRDYVNASHRTLSLPKCKRLKQSPILKRDCHSRPSVLLCNDGYDTTSTP